MASYYESRMTRSLLAAVDLSGSQFLYVSDNGSGLANIAGSINGAIGLGFLMNEPEAGEACEIAATGGGAKGVAAETISAALTQLKADADGKMAVALPGDIVSAIAMETAAAADVFEVLPVYYPKSSTPVIFAAAGDLTSGQYLYVGNSSGDIAVVGGATGALGYGFLQNAPDTGEDAVISGPGHPFSKAISADNTVEYGVELRSDAAGKMELADTAGDIVSAISLSDASAADETIDVIPVLYRKHA